MNENFEKMKIAIRYWMIGRKYHTALKAMDFAEGYHTGLRKDGNHEFSHQISQINYIRAFIDLLLFPEETLCVIFLHDVIEDYNVSYDEIKAKFGVKIADAVWTMSKVRNGVKMDDNVYYEGITECPMASIAKVTDRLHNLMSMLGGFKPEKRATYIEHSLSKVVPMMKECRRRFPEQEVIYENAKYIMTNQVNLYNEINKMILEDGK